MFLLIVIFILLFSAFIFWLFTVLSNYRRLLKVSDNFWQLSRIPLIGHLHLFPKSRYDVPEFLIGHANRALRDGHNAMCWWFASELNIWALDSESAKEILENSAELIKGNDYDFFKQWLGEGLLLSTGAKWKRQRRILTPTFHFAKLEQYTDIFNGKARELVQSLTNLASADDNSSKAEDISEMIRHISLAIAAEAIMGVRLQKDSHCEYVKAVADFNRHLHDFVMTPLFYFCPFAWFLLGRGFATRKCVHKLKAFTAKIIGERIEIRAQQRKHLDKERANNKKSGDSFLDTLLDMEGNDTLEPEELREQVDTFMFAGHDTTSHALIWTLWCIACHPQYQRLIHAEIDAKCQEMNAKGIAEEISFKPAHVNELRYMDRCIRESLRMFPAVPVVERQLQNDLAVNGKVWPRGALAVVAPILIHHNEQVYPNHWQFDPDNFLPEKVAKRNAFDYIPFSGGPRNCIGQKFAMLQLKIVLAHLFYNFHFSTEVPFLQNLPALEPILRPQNGLPLKITKRKCEIIMNEEQRLDLLMDEKNSEKIE
ncbi:hypothetical protein niasHS_005772 [Heterodera schachtii]|uniref:Cytochrome P450 n=1 Tax=Heterodera schachtii TaxID=97005 RepID=A0ABD2JZK4_HETSC